jgi:N-acetylglucosamine-6-sulfatase
LLSVLLSLFVLGTYSDAGPAEAQALKRPSFVFIYTDDMRADEFVKIRSLRALASRGVSFDNAYVTNSVCCPSRATALTGRYSENHGVLNNGGENSTGGGGYAAWLSQGLGEKSLPSWMRLAGYDTYLGGKFLNGYASDDPPEGFDRYFRTASPAEDPEIGSEAARFVKDNRGPLFLALWPRSPHVPLVPAKRFEGSHSEDRIDLSPAYAEEDRSDKAEWIHSTEAPPEESIVREARTRLEMLEGVGLAMARVKSALRETGRAENTYWIFSSDNGYQFGEHGLHTKAVPYEESVRVPFVIAGPKIAEGTARDEMVLNNDIAPTIAELAAVEPNAPMDGRSLTPLLMGREPPEDWRTAAMSENPGFDARPGHRLLRTERYAYVEWATGERELYDMKADPDQAEGKISPQEEALAETMADRLETIDSCSGRSCRTAENRVP